MCAAFPEFNHLRLLKEGFDLIYKQPDRASAEKVFKRWCELVPPTGKHRVEDWEHRYGVQAELYAELRALKNTMSTRWHDEIFNYFDEDGRKTNAIAEATNSFFERVVINGYSFKRMRARALYWYDVDPRTRYVLESRKQLDTSRTSFFNPNSPSSFEYVDVYGIYEVQEDDSRGKRNALNMLSFLPEGRLDEIANGD